MKTLDIRTSVMRNLSKLLMLEEYLHYADAAYCVALIIGDNLSLIEYCEKFETEINSDTLKNIGTRLLVLREHFKKFNIITDSNTYKEFETWAKEAYKLYLKHSPELQSGKITPNQLHAKSLDAFASVVPGTFPGEPGKKLLTKIPNSSDFFEQPPAEKQPSKGILSWLGRGIKWLFGCCFATTNSSIPPGKQPASVQPATAGSPQRQSMEEHDANNLSLFDSQNTSLSLMGVSSSPLRSPLNLSTDSNRAAETPGAPQTPARTPAAAAPGTSVRTPGAGLFDGSESAVSPRGKQPLARQLFHNPEPQKKHYHILNSATTGA